jgi:hypothetical protein
MRKNASDTVWYNTLHSMRLNEFIATVLDDINTGLEQAQSKTGKNYSLETGEYPDVRFDLAITPVHARRTKKEGAGKAAFIEVLEANLEERVDNKEEKSQVSRIQFIVDVTHGKPIKFPIDTDDLHLDNPDELINPDDLPSTKQTGRLPNGYIDPDKRY